MSNPKDELNSVLEVIGINKNVTLQAMHLSEKEFSTMAKTIDIFVDATVEMENFARELELLLDLEFQLISEDYETWYEFHNSTITLTLGEQDFENDRDMNFAAYRYHLSIRALNLKTEAERKKWRDEFGQVVFQKLKVTQKYSLMLIDDLQVKVVQIANLCRNSARSKRKLATYATNCVTPNPIHQS